MSQLHDYKVFVGEMQEWVDTVADPDLDRAWRLTKGCLTVHAVVDKQTEQSLEQSCNVAWDDFVSAYNGHEATYFMAALADDFRIAAPPGHDEPMIMVVDRAYRAASQSPDRKRAKKTNRARRPIRLTRE